MEPEHRRAVRSRLAQLLGRKLEDVVPDSGLVELAREPRRLQAAVTKLVRELGVSVDARALAGARTVHHLVTLVSDAVRQSRRESPRGATRSPVRPLEPPAEASGAAAESAPDGPAPATAPPTRQARGETYQCAIPYEAERIRAAAVYCSDGRIGDHVDDFLHNGLGLPRYDRLACPGGPIALSGRLSSFWECHSVEEQLRFLVRAHDVTQVVLIVHQPCAYYAQRLGIPDAALEAEQQRDLQHAAWAVQRADPALEVAGFVAWADGASLRFEKVLATPALEQRAKRWRG